MPSRSLRVTVMGFNYAPEPTGIAPYTTRMAAGLNARGHEITVVTTFPHYPHWRIAEGYSGFTRREMHAGIPIKRLRHYVPQRPTGLRRGLSEMSFGMRCLFTGWHDPDVVVFASPALLSTAMTLGWIGRRADRPAVGVILQDLYSVGIAETDAGGGVASRLLTRLEGAVARRADGVSVIHDRFKDRVVDHLGVAAERVSVIRNWTHLPDVDPFHRQDFRAQLGWAPGDSVVLHAGAMGEKQGLSNVVEAARLADQRDSQVQFVLLGDGKQRRALEDQARGVSRLTFLDPLPGGDYARAMRSADLLLVNEKPGVVEMAVPSKLTSYFSTGVPVLAATETNSTTADELRASGAGVRVRPGDPAALLEAALGLSADPTRATSIGSRGPAYCARVLDEELALDAYDAWIRQLHAHRSGRREGR